MVLSKKNIFYHNIDTKSIVMIYSDLGIYMILVLTVGEIFNATTKKRKK